MAQLTDGFKDIFLAGIGAMAVTGEKAKEMVDQLIEKGELTVEQGKQVNSELTHKAAEQAEKVGEGVLEASMRAMTPEQRAAFAARAAELAKELGADDAKAAAEPLAGSDDESDAAAPAVGDEKPAQA